MVQYSIVVSARARADLLAARRWLSQPGSGLKARLTMARINRAILELGFAPERWAIGDMGGVRERFVEGYAVHYRFDSSKGRIVVLRVFGRYQNRSEP